jgi:hypothetical protein
MTTSAAQAPAPAGRSIGDISGEAPTPHRNRLDRNKGDVHLRQSQVRVERETEDLAIRYPLVARHSGNYAAKLIQRAWKRYMMRIVYMYLLQCSKEFEETLKPTDLSRIYPEFLESSDPRMTAKLRIRLQGESFPPCLVCRILADLAPSVDGGKHFPKWIPLCNAGKIVPVDQKALVHLFIEAAHSLREPDPSVSALSLNSG